MARRNRSAVLERQWSDDLRKAHQAGAGRPACNYNRRIRLANLLGAREGNQYISPEELKDEVDAMTHDLHEYSSELPDNQQSEKLDSDQGALLEVIEYTAGKWEAEHVRLLHSYQFDYPGKEVAPTRMGNVANTAAYYAASRYDMNLEMFWSRLQKIIQSDSNFYGVLQDAKTQVDFLVSLIWLTIAFTLIWVVMLPFLARANILFSAIAVLGPSLTYVWYRVALQSYRAFSDLLRASVDLYRLDLLKTLRLSLPANAEQERVVWRTLEARIGYGEDTNIGLQYP
jgi:hypothetical protein